MTKDQLKVFTKKYWWTAVIILLLAGGGAMSYLEYRDISENIVASEGLSADGNHAGAIETLGRVNGSWLVRNLGVKEDVIENDIAEFNKRLESQGVYNSALTKIEEKELQTAIDLLAGIPEDSFYYQLSQTTIAELERAILEGSLAIEKIARKTAESRAISAEQQAITERLAKEEQQLQTVAQTQRADEEERARYLELSRTNPVINALVTGELTFYIDPIPNYAGDGVSGIIEELVQSFDDWELYGASIRQVSNPNDADVTISWIRDYGGDTLGESIFRAHLKIGLGSNNCFEEWRAFDAQTVGKIFWHELGHSMGYGHSNDSDNIMYYQLDTRFDVEREVEDVIAAGWTWTIPFCESGQYYYSFNTGNSYDGFDIFILPQGTNGSDVAAGTGQYYPDCSAEGMSSYSDTCTVGSGSKIYLENTSFSNTIRISGEIVNLDEPPVPDTEWPDDVFQYDTEELAKIQNLFR